MGRTRDRADQAIIPGPINSSVYNTTSIKGVSSERGRDPLEAHFCCSSFGIETRSRDGFVAHGAKTDVAKWCREVVQAAERLFSKAA